MEPLLQAYLEPGDVLYIPKNWWHYVMSFEPSLSISSFGLTPLEMVYDGVPDVYRWTLHSLGLYGQGCTCHPLEEGNKQESVLKSTAIQSIYLRFS